MTHCEQRPTAQSLSLAEVTAWLRANNYGTTALELFSEVKRCTGESYMPLLDAAEASQRRLLRQQKLLQGQSTVGHMTLTTPHNDGSADDTELSAASLHTTSASSSSKALPAAASSPTRPSNLLSFGNPESNADDTLTQTLAECLDAFGAAKGAQALSQLLASRGGSEAKAEVVPSPPDAGCAIRGEEEHESATLARRAREAETQLKQLVVLVSDSLATLIPAVDPMKKEAFLPLLRSVAILADSSTSRAAARHAILHLFKRPTQENRASIVAEWLRVTQGVSRRAVEQEVIPELYGLVNARTPERRQLALDCAYAIAGHLQDAYKVRCSLCQGLLRPLSEDEASAVRREVPACLGALWGGEVPASTMTASTSPRNLMSETDDALDPRSLDAAAELTSLRWAPLTHQSTFPMELAVRLAIDPFSNSVRHASQAQLRQVIYPRCLRDRVLLTTFVPLLMTFIGMEVAPLRVDEVLSPTVPASAGVQRLPARTTGFASKDDGLSSKLKRATNSTTLAYSNVVMLAKLCGDAMQCVKAFLVRMRDAEPGTESNSDSLDSTRDEVCDVYLRDVLPTAHTLLPSLLQSFSGATGAHRLVNSPLCGLCAALAEIVPALNRRSWERVKAYFLSSLQLPVSSPASGLDGPRPGDEAAEARGRLLFFYAVFIRLAGEQSAFHERRSGSPYEATGGATTTATAATASSSSLSWRRRDAQAFANEVGRESAALVLQSLSTTKSTVPLSTDERMRLLALCLGQLGALSFSEHDRLSAGVIAVLWSFAESPAVTQRLHVISLVTQVCTQPLEDGVKLSFVCPPLFVLLNDPEAMVQEMAVKGLLSVAAGLTQPAAQEKVLRPTMATVEASGCTSDLTFATLHQWEELLGTMPAEPREVFLYPHLNVLMDLLSDQQTRRMLTREQQQQQAQAQWERAVLGLTSLLAAILRCAVVTPPLVERYLMPGIRHFASSGVLTGPALSPQLRARWERLDKSYEAFLESNSSALAATHQAANLINRVRDELKRRF